MACHHAAHDRTGEVVLIDRGFVPEEMRDPSSRAQGELGGVVAVTGFVRVPETQGYLHPRQRGRGQSLVLARSCTPWRASIGAAEVAPFFLEAEKSDVPGGWPEGGQTRLELPNNHLQYAITWFLMAGALLVIYGAYVRSLYRPSLL